MHLTEHTKSLYGSATLSAPLSIHGLGRRFNNVVALADFDLDVPPGQVLGIIGRSGAGKSTLLRLINRLVEPSSGSIRFGDVDVTALKGRALRAWRASAAMIFQQFNLIPRLDVLTNVLIGSLHHQSVLSGLLGLFSAEERALALETLDQFDLAEVALQRAGTLSGGQQQRVAICRALLQRPRLILADEPVASLDPRNAALVMEALQVINERQRLTILVNLHHLDAARHYCERIVALRDGRLVFDGSPRDLSAARVMDIYGMTEAQLQEMRPDARNVP